LVFNPVVYFLLTLGLVMYFRAVRILARRGYDVPLGQQLAYYMGIFVTSVGLVSPIGSLAEQLLVAHMAEHLLIADIAAPLLLVGIRSPVYVFLLPRPVLVRVARTHWLRRGFRFIRRPLVALPIFTVVLYGWHLPPAFEGSVRHSGIHALQHASFVGASMLVWWSALEPKRRRMPGQLWKIGHIFTARMISMFLGVAFVFTRHPIYAGVYGQSARKHGLSPLADQQFAGGMMMTLDILVMAFALILFFYRAAQDYDLNEAPLLPGAPGVPTGAGVKGGASTGPT
jgi:putative membrane protein